MNNKKVRCGNILQCVRTTPLRPHVSSAQLKYRAAAHQQKTTWRLLWIIICITSIQMNIKQ